MPNLCNTHFQLIITKEGLCYSLKLQETSLTNKITKLKIVVAVAVVVVEVVVGVVVVVMGVVVGVVVIVVVVGVVVG